MKLKADGLAASDVYALHLRMSQVMSDAVHEGLLTWSLCSRRTSLGASGQPAILLGAFVGVRTAEAVGLRGKDVDFMRGVVRPTVQGAGEELKTETSKTPLPLPQSWRWNCRPL